MPTSLGYSVLEDVRIDALRVTQADDDSNRALLRIYLIADSNRSNTAQSRSYQRHRIQVPTPLPRKGAPRSNAEAI
jgi:hypothetical protein